VNSSASAQGAQRRRSVGRSGEDRAAKWYIEHGYELVARNWRCREGEIDLVARHGRLTVFCEVKARSTTAFGTPAEAVGPAKQARLRRLAACWFAGRPARPSGWAGGPVRFDIASVLGSEIEVIEGAL
jgi:putative endonuclease